MFALFEEGLWQRMLPAFCAKQNFADDLAHLLFQKTFDPVFGNEHKLGVHVSYEGEVLF